MFGRAGSTKPKGYLAGFAPGDCEEILAETVKGEAVEGKAVSPPHHFNSHIAFSIR